MTINDVKKRTILHSESEVMNSAETVHCHVVLIVE